MNRFVLGFCLLSMAGPVMGASLTHEIYIWQRIWGPDVEKAVDRAAAAAEGFIPLAAQIDVKEHGPEAHTFPVGYATLKAAQRPVGLAVRVGPYSGPFDADAEVTRALRRTVAEVLDRASEQGVEVAELQIDFDCATSKLEGYRQWVRLLKTDVKPLPVTITALPTWLSASAFRDLAEEAGQYVLQLHGLDAPSPERDDRVLFDAGRALRTVARADRLGVPYRVALPTYGYILEFGADGALVRVRAEGRASAPADDVSLRLVQSNPEAVARVLASWEASRPERLTGVLWYRLPLDTDRLNWPWSTLAAVMAGRVPHSELSVYARSPKGMLHDIYLENGGETDMVRPPRVRVVWQGPRAVASDGLNDYGVVAADAGLQLVRDEAKRFVYIRPGQKLHVGWVRLMDGAEVEVCLDDDGM